MFLTALFSLQLMVVAKVLRKLQKVCRTVLNDSSWALGALVPLAVPIGDVVVIRPFTERLSVDYQIELTSLVVNKLSFEIGRIWKVNLIRDHT